MSFYFQKTIDIQNARSKGYDCKGYFDLFRRRGKCSADGYSPTFPRHPVNPVEYRIRVVTHKSVHTRTDRVARALAHVITLP